MRLWKRVRMWAGRKKFEADLAEEIRLHRELAGEAAFGSVALTLEESREVWGFAWLEGWKQDVQYSLRSLRNSPGFALGVIGAIGLGIGLNTTLFTVFNAYVLRPYAVRDPYSLYEFRWYPKGGNGRNFTRAQFEEVRKSNAAFSDVLATVPLWVQVDRHTVLGHTVSENYFSMLDARMALGRPLATEGNVTALVLGYEAWRNKFGGDPGILGRKLYVRGQPFEVVGVAAPAFAGMSDIPDNFWIPLGAAPKVREGNEGLQLIGRLRPGVTAEAAKSPLLAWVRRFAPNAVGVAMMSRATSVPLTKDAVLTFLPIFTAFGLVLLIACANVSNMMLARGLARQREVAIRVSLGAPRRRLIRQLLTESVLLAAPASLAGFAISEGMIRTARWLMYATMPPSFGAVIGVADLAPDWRVFTFILATAVGTGLLFGLAPAVQTTRSRVVEANRGDFSSDYRPARLRNALVVVQVATCALLLISTTVVLRSEGRVTAHEVGIDTHGVWDVEAEGSYQQVVAQGLQGQPGVEVLSTALHVPMLGSGQIVAIPSGSGQSGTLRTNFVSAGYFSVLRIPVRRGRVFTEAEAAAEAPVAVVSESTAQRLWPERDAIGESIAIPALANARASYAPLPRFPTALVIGVVGDVHSRLTRGNDEDTEVYFPPHPAKDAAVLVRMSGSVRDQRRKLQEMLDGIAPSLADVIVSMDDTIALRVYSFRVVSGVAGFLAGVGLLLTVTGIYGVMSYLVSQRTKEIGIRVALGASAGDVVRMVLRQSGWLAGMGAAVGAGLALAVAPIFAHQLEAIQPYDWVPYAATTTVVVAAALAASWDPARRAVGVDPVRTLRCD